MQKCLLITLTIMFLITCPALAEEPNLELLSDGELVSLISKFQVELFSRGIEMDSLIYPGVYVTSQDINAGHYICQCINVKYNMNIIIFESEDAYNVYLKSPRSTMGENFEAIYKNARSYQQLSEGGFAMLNLQDGMVLVIEYGIGKLDVNKSPWAP